MSTNNNLVLKKKLAKLYLDGILKATDSTVDTVDTQSTSAIIGNGPETVNRYFNGQIDDIKIYNYALTPQQIKTDYNLSAIFFGPLTGSP